MPREHINDERWMRVALSLAKRGLGQVAPNPSVGCVIVKDDIVLGRGWTQPGGRPHAEPVALAEAGDAASGATVYVTLEPCSHTGQTPPCAEALVETNVRRVVIATIDPDSRVDGNGVAKLKAAGIDVTVGVLQKEADVSHRAFFSRVTNKRPFFTLKLATTLDGKIALANGESKWITGFHARQFSHRMRAEHDAILVGSGTVLADDPSLTCRMDGVSGRDPVRIILDRRGRTLKRDAPLKGDVPTVVVTEQGASAVNGFDILQIEPSTTLTDIAAMLADQGLNSVLVEGGGAVAASFLAAGLVDRLEVFGAGKVVGDSGIGAVADLGLAKLADAPHFTLRKIRHLGPDILASYDKAE